MHTWTTRVSQDCSQDVPPASAFGLTAPQPGSMAHIVKWWRAWGKTRFFNGYKQLSALQQDGHDGRSDTEELLCGGRPSPSPCPGPLRESREGCGSQEGLKERERTPSQERAARRERLPSPDREKDMERDKGEKEQPKPQPSQQPEPQPNRQINFEEFECDVSVEGGVDEAGQERQEFSFTLYDFDGHGKITKDDITGLVSTIYETLGASITVPHYGSKTIKVKLTVSPDKRHGGSKGATATYANTATYVNGGVTGSAAAVDNAAEPQTTPPTRVRFKRDLNVTIQERRPVRQTTRRASSASVRRRPSAAATAATAAAAAAAAAQREREHSEDRGYVVHSCGSSCRGSGPGSEGSGEDEDVDDEEDDCRPAAGLSPASVAAAAATAATVATAAANVANGVGANGCQSPLAKKRSSSMQRQELLQIIQANMEKNNLCFQTAKKSCAEKTGLEERRHSHSGVHPHHRRQKQKAPPPVSLSASASPQRIYDYATTPYYVNLADKGECPGDADTYRYVVCTPKHQPTYHNVPCRERSHNRSRSHDLTTNTHSHAHQHNHSHSHNPAAPLFRYTLLQEDATSSVQAFHVRPSRSPAITRRARLPPTAAGHTAVGHTSSPHHLKHRNREQDQARAMAQVVQWLEQEFSASLNTRTSAGVQEVLINAKAQRTKSKAAAFAPVPEAPPAPPAAPNANSNSNSSRPDEDPSPSGPGVKQHEHHHVHEHIHHHYHHYQDTSPVLV